MVRFLNLVKPVMCILPEVATPENDQNVPFKTKLMWTVITLFIFLICCQIPLYGVISNEASDPLHFMRAYIASNRGTLMELGVTPIMTSGMIMQLLAGAKTIDVDMSIEEDRKLFQGAQKLFGILITIGEGVAFVLSGMYGDVKDLGAGNAILIILQLFFAGILIILLDELLEKGYGFGSGISLFIATNTCETIAWKAFSPITVNLGEGEYSKGPEFEGAIVALFHLLITRSNKFSALYEAFYRSHLPNLWQMCATFIIFIIVIYLQGFRVDLPVKHAKHRGQQGTYPIKLFYTSNMPIIFKGFFVGILYSVSQTLFRRYPSNPLVRFFGVWGSDGSQMSGPVSGIAYYISPPMNVAEIFYDPIRFVIYFCFVLGVCAMFSALWIEVSNTSPRHVAKQLRNENMVIKGFRDKSVITVLNRYIPIAATFGGMVIGALTILADFMGAIGSGTGILLATTMVYAYYEKIIKEDRTALY